MKVACIQFTASETLQDNLDMLQAMIREAAAQGAEFIATPENSDFMLFSQEEKLKLAYEEDNHPALPQLSDLVKELGIELLIGSLAIREEERLYNRSYLISSSGERIAHYDKIHLFDVDLAGGESYRESNTVRAGEHAVLAKTPWGSVGMSICYDVRFAHLYRHLAQGGADILTVPAAFTVPTGQAHWEVLLRARAIETGCFVMAPAQVGTHSGNRKTYGHAMIISPWGEILAKAGDQPTIITADIDLSDVKKARSAIPALQHDRGFKLPIKTH